MQHIKQKYHPDHSPRRRSLHTLADNLCMTINSLSPTNVQQYFYYQFNVSHTILTIIPNHSNSQLDSFYPTEINHHYGLCEINYQNLLFTYDISKDLQFKRLYRITNFFDILADLNKFDIKIIIDDALFININHGPVRLKKSQWFNIPKIVCNYLMLDFDDEYSHYDPTSKMIMCELLKRIHVRKQVIINADNYLETFIHVPKNLIDQVESG